MSEPVVLSQAAVNKLRAKIHQDVEDFLASGGVITVVPAGVSGIKEVSNEIDKAISTLDEHEKNRVRHYGIYNKELYLK